REQRRTSRRAEGEGPRGNQAVPPWRRGRRQPAEAGLLRLGWSRSQLHREGLRLAVSRHRYLQAVAGVASVDRVANVVRRGNLPAAARGHDVALAKAGARGRAAAGYRSEPNATGSVLVVELDAEEGVLHGAAAHQLRHDLLHRVDRDGVPDADVRSGRARDL